MTVKLMLLLPALLWLHPSKVKAESVCTTRGSNIFADSSNSNLNQIQYFAPLEVPCSDPGFRLGMILPGQKNATATRTFLSFQFRMPTISASNDSTIQEVSTRLHIVATQTFNNSSATSSDREWSHQLDWTEGGMVAFWEEKADETGGRLGDEWCNNSKGGASFFDDHNQSDSHSDTMDHLECDNLGGGNKSSFVCGPTTIRAEPGTVMECNVIVQSPIGCNETLQIQASLQDLFLDDVPSNHLTASECLVGLEVEEPCSNYTQSDEQQTEEGEEEICTIGEISPHPKVVNNVKFPITEVACPPAGETRVLLSFRVQMPTLWGAEKVSSHLSVAALYNKDSYFDLDDYLSLHHHDIRVRIVEWSDGLGDYQDYWCKEPRWMRLHLDGNLPSYRNIHCYDLFAQQQEEKTANDNQFVCTSRRIDSEPGALKNITVRIAMPQNCTGTLQLQAGIQDYGGYGFDDDQLVTFDGDNNSSQCLSSFVVERPCDNYTQSEDPIIDIDPDPDGAAEEATDAEDATIEPTASDATENSDNVTRSEEVDSSASNVLTAGVVILVTFAAWTLSPI